jgi:hypothetical protein
MDLIGKKVTVYSVGATNDPADIGVIEKIDGPWLWLRKNEREVLIFNVERIRVLKPFETL